MSVNITNFYKRNGGLSSTRTTIGDNKNSTSTTTYHTTGKGGWTFKNSGISTRMNSSGTSIGSGIKSGNSTTYFGSHGNVISNLPSFK